METPDNQELDSLLTTYKGAIEQWIRAIRAEESLAVPDHSMQDWEIWDRACLAEKDAGKKAAEARKDYEDALRKVLLKF